MDVLVQLRMASIALFRWRAKHGVEFLPASIQISPDFSHAIGVNESVFFGPANCPVARKHRVDFAANFCKLKRCRRSAYEMNVSLLSWYFPCTARNVSVASLSIKERNDFDVEGGVGSPERAAPTLGEGSALWKASRSSSFLWGAINHTLKENAKELVQDKPVST